MKTEGGRKSIVNKQCQGWVCDRNEKMHTLEMSHSEILSRSDVPPEINSKNLSKKPKNWFRS